MKEKGGGFSRPPTYNKGDSTMAFGLGGNGTKRAKRKAWSEEAERGKRIREAQKVEIRRRKAEEKARYAEERRKREIERLRKRRELFVARAEEREALARQRRAKRVASRSAYLFGGLGKGARKATRVATRKRGKKAKIGWF